MIGAIISKHAKVCQIQTNNCLSLIEQESPADAKGTRDSSACMKAHC